MRLDLARSWMIGDMLSDAHTGRNAAPRRTILVRSGRGATTEQSADDALDYVTNNLLEAATLIMSEDASVGSRRNDEASKRQRIGTVELRCTSSHHE